MTERLTLAEYNALRPKGQARRRRSSLSAVAERAVARVTPVKGKSSALHIIGIDPGRQTGFAIYSRVERRLVDLFSTDFWGALEKIASYPATEVLIIIEVSEGMPTYRELKDQAPSPDALAKIAVNVGQVIEQSIQLAEGLRRRGYQVIESQPLGKKNQEEFKRLTGWQKRTNQHERDAGVLAYGY